MNNFDLINWDSFSCLDQMPGGIPIPSAAEDSNQLDFQWGVDLNRELNSQELLEAFERSISRENEFEGVSSSTGNSGVAFTDSSPI